MQPIAPLQQIVRQLLAAEVRTKKELRGGLVLIAHPPDQKHPYHRRIVACRQNSIPSDRELEIVRRELIIAVATQPLTSIGVFSSLESVNGWNGSDIWIYSAPRHDQAAQAIPEDNNG